MNVFVVTKMSEVTCSGCGHRFKDEADRIRRWRQEFGNSLFCEACRDEVSAGLRPNSKQIVLSGPKAEALKDVLAALKKAYDLGWCLNAPRICAEMGKTEGNKCVLCELWGAYCSFKEL